MLGFIKLFRARKIFWSFLMANMFVLFSLSTLFGQQKHIIFQNYFVNDGISGSKINTLLVDYLGYLWIGTIDGLNRYDGNRFAKYHNNPLDKNTINSNYVNHLFETKDKLLWVCTTSGLAHYDRKKDIFHPIDIKIDGRTIDNINITSALEDSDGDIWITTAGYGIIRYVRKSGQFYIFNVFEANHEQNRANFVWSICEDDKKCIWIGADNGIHTFHLSEKKQPKFKRLPNLDPKVQTIWWLSKTKDGSIWAGALGVGMLKINPQTKNITYLTTSNSGLCNINTYSFFQDSESRIWIGTNAGLNRTDLLTKSFAHYKNIPNKTTSIPDNNIWSIVEDHSGIIWFATSKGLSKFDKRIAQFSYFDNIPDDPNSLINNYVQSIELDSDSCIWIGTKSGLDRFNIRTGRAEHFFQEKKYPEVLKNISVRGLKKDKENNLWICTWGAGIFKYNPQTKKLTQYINTVKKYAALSNNYTRKIFFDKEGIAWIGTLDGLDRLDPKTEQFTSYRPVQGDTTTLSSRYIFDIYEDSFGNLWVGSIFNGLNKFDRKTGKCVQFINKKQVKGSISGNIIICIKQTKDHTLWIGTRSGLNKFDYKTQKFKTYTKNDGLPNDAILGIIEDKNGYMWISTNFGISKFDPKTEKFKNYFQKDGLQDNEFNAQAYVLMPTGEMVFGGTNGFNVFNPEKIKDNLYKPKTVLTDFKIWNQSVKIGDTINGEVLLKNAISETDSIEISHKNNAFTIDFSALDYSAPKFNEYAYMLEGFDKNWNFTSADRRFVTYTNLDGGKYIFKVKCTNANGYWNDNYRSLHITVLPPFWKTLWFRFLIFIAIILLVLLYVRSRLRIIKRQKEILEAQVMERTAEILAQRDEIVSQNEQLQILNATKDKLFRIIAHDLRNPFGSILGLTELLCNEKVEPDQRNRFERLILDSARNGYNLLENLLQWALSQTGRLVCNPEYIPVNMLAEQVINLVKNAAYLKNIEISTQIDNAIQVWADINLTETILRNLVSNAIKYTQKNGKIQISASSENGSTTICVTDSGIGIGQENLNKLFGLLNTSSSRGTENEKGTGLGLSLCKEFVEKQGGTIWAESELGKGSSFYFALPTTGGQ
jgi:signal transduction histidine kinase/ligand-binding sensor domain-containing protein